jgi:hypothetical protein
MWDLRSSLLAMIIDSVGETLSMLSADALRYRSGRPSWLHAPASQFSRMFTARFSDMGNAPWSRRWRSGVILSAQCPFLVGR